MLTPGAPLIRPPTGTWSTTASGLHDDAFENETLTFERRGHGTLRFERPGYTDLVLFTWHTPCARCAALVYCGRRESADGTTRHIATDMLPTLICYEFPQSLWGALTR